MSAAEEAVQEGIKFTEKLLGLRALFNLRVSNYLYNAIPPPGFLLSAELKAALTQDEGVANLLKGCEQLAETAAEVIEQLKDGDKRDVPALAASLLDTLRSGQPELKAIKQSVSHTLQQFKVKYSETNYALELWQPDASRKFRRTADFMKTHCLPAVRNNPELRRLIRRTEAADLDMGRLVLKRHSVKSATTTGLRSSKVPVETFIVAEPSHMRVPSKQRELKSEVIPQLVQFMPKLSAFSPAPPPPESRDDALDSLNEEDEDLVSDTTSTSAED